MATVSLNGTARPPRNAAGGPAAGRGTPTDAADSGTGQVTGSYAPQLTLRVGVTGHYKAERLPDAEIPRIRDEVAGVLALLEDCVNAVMEGAARHFIAPDYSLQMISSLAERADRIAAQAAVAAKWQLNAILPFPPKDYEQDFESPASKAEFWELLEKRPIFALPALAAAAKRHDGYVAVGRVVLDQCDILLAIWDGDPAHGPGGSAEVIAEAQRRTMPVVWIHSKDPTRGPRLLQKKEWMALATDRPGRETVLAPRVDELLAPPGEDAVSAHEAGSGKDSGALRLRYYLADAQQPGWPWSAHRSRFPWWRAYTSFADLLAWVGRLLRSEPAETPPAPARSFSPDELLRAFPAAGRLTEALRETLLPSSYRADDVASHRGHIYRSAYVLNFLLAAAAVIVGLLAGLWLENIWAKLVSVAIELGLIAVVLWLTLTGMKLRWHRRWLDARTLAELFRPAPYLALVGLGEVARHEASGERGDRWLTWYARATLREVGPPDAVIDAPYLRRLIDAAIHTIVDPQISYHHGNRIRLSNLHHGLDRLGEILFKTTFMVGAVFLIGVLGAGFLMAVFGGRPLLESYHCINQSSVMHVLKPLLTVLAAGLPALGAALAGIRAQGDFQAFASRSQQTETALSDIRERLLAARAAPDFETLRGLLSEAARSMTADLDDWVQLYRHRPIGLPM